MPIEIVSTFSRFAELRPDWNRLAGDIPMRSWEWAYSWSETMLGSNRLLILVASDQAGQVIGIAPFYLSSDWIRGDVIHLIGDGTCCTDYGTLLADSERRDEFLDLLVPWLSDRSVGCTLDELERLDADDERWLGWDLIKLEGVEQHDLLVHRLVERLAQVNCTSHLRSHCATWSVELPDSWEQYVGSLSKSQRRNVRLVQRRVLDDPAVVVCKADDQQSLEYGMKWLRELHQRRWESVGQPGCFADEGFASFFTAVAQRMFEASKLRLMWLEKDGQPIAVDFTFLGSESTYGYQMGVDPDYRDQELGRALLVAAMQATHHSGRTTFDFLRGNESYKTRWNGQEHPLLDIEIVPDRGLPQLRQSLADLGRTVKSKISARF